MPTHTDRRACWTLVILSMLLLLSGTGCAATLVAMTGTAEHELSVPTTRAEVHKRFGEPTATAVGPEGGAIDTYHLRRKLGVPDPRNVKIDSDWAMLLGGTWLIANVLAYGAPEAVLAGVVYVESVRTGFEIIYAYDPQNRILVSYPESSTPAERLDATQRQLTQRLLASLDAPEAPLGPPVEAHVGCLHHWAAYLGAGLSPEAEAALDRARTLAAAADGGERPRAEALADLKTCLVSGCLVPAPPNPAPDGETRDRVDDAPPPSGPLDNPL